MDKPTCSIPECELPVLCKGICSLHYNRLRSGNHRIHRVSLIERLWSSVQRGGPDECWIWHASRDAKGYGKINAVEMGQPSAPQKVSRVVYWLTYGELPPVVRHRCDNPPCCNPAHLEAGTKADNNRDMAERGRASRGEDHVHSRLTTPDVLSIRAAVDRGERHRIIAERFGISHQTVSDISQRKRWKHVA